MGSASSLFFNPPLGRRSTAAFLWWWWWWSSRIVAQKWCRANKHQWLISRCIWRFLIPLFRLENDWMFMFIAVFLREAGNYIRTEKDGGTMWCWLQGKTENIQTGTGEWRRGTEGRRRIKTGDATLYRLEEGQQRLSYDVARFIKKPQERKDGERLPTWRVKQKFSHTSSRLDLRGVDELYVSFL